MMDGQSAHANALRENGEPEAALDIHDELCARHTTTGYVQADRGLTLQSLGRFPEARTAYKQALVLEPDNPEIHCAYASLLLVQQQWQEGWQEYEWREHLQQFNQGPTCYPPFPVWDGVDYPGQTLLIHAEQGYGDTIQFIRFVPYLAERLKMWVVLLVQEALLPLYAEHPVLKRLRISVRPYDQAPSGNAWRLGLLSVPRWLYQWGAEGVPRPAKPLTGRFGLMPASKRWLGLVWSGRSDHPRNQQRSVPLRELLPLAAIADIAWYSLQVGDAAADVRQLDEWPVVDLSSALVDFGVTAAVLSQLDGVITVDTAVAHLAGSLGVPTWLLLNWFPDWRWGMAETETCWYPSVQLVRQQVRGSWREPVERVVRVLAR